MAQLVIHQTDKKQTYSSINGSQGSTSTAAEGLISDIEAEHLPVITTDCVAASRNFIQGSSVSTNEFAAIQTLARVYCEADNTASHIVTLHPMNGPISSKTCSSTVTDL